MKVIEFPFVSVRNERINCMVVLKILMPEPQPRPIKSQIDHIGNSVENRKQYGQLNTETI